MPRMRPIASCSEHIRSRFAPETKKIDRIFFSYNQKTTSVSQRVIHRQNQCPTIEKIVGQPWRSLRLWHILWQTDGRTKVGGGVTCRIFIHVGRSRLKRREDWEQKSSGSFIVFWLWRLCMSKPFVSSNYFLIQITATTHVVVLYKEQCS
jgi:hypothetical protein